MQNQSEKYEYKFTPSTNTDGEDLLSEALGLPEGTIDSANNEFTILMSRYIKKIEASNPGTEVYKDILSKREEYAKKPMKDVIEEFYKRSADNARDISTVAVSNIVLDLIKTFSPEELALFMAVNIQRDLREFANSHVAQDTLRLLELPYERKSDQDAMLIFTDLLLNMERHGNMKAFFKTKSFTTTLMFFLVNTEHIKFKDDEPESGEGK